MEYSMVIFPAVDIKDGRCVRLLRGEFDTAETVYESPLSSALNFKEQGAEYLHLVDLDGSLEKKPVNHEIIADIQRKTGLFCEVGGGIRSMADIEMYADLGISRVILGSAALRDPDFVRRAVKEYGTLISVGIDAKDGMVCAEGWLETSQVGFLDFALEMEQIGLRHIIYTDISTDGTLQGPNFDHLSRLQKTVSMDITASGGIRDKGHIERLREMGLYGAICGKSLYCGTLSLSEIL